MASPILDVGAVVVAVVVVARPANDEIEMGMDVVLVVETLMFDEEDIVVVELVGSPKNNNNLFGHYIKNYTKKCS